MGRNGSALILAILMTVLSLNKAYAQVLATGETGGKGNQAVMVTVNGLYPEGLTLFNANIQYTYGLSDRLDGILVYGNISTSGEAQNYVGFGWNLSLSKRDKSFVDVSFFNTVNIPITRRRESSTILMTPALVVSRPVLISGKNVVLYSGLNSTVPIGSVSNKLFTPSETLLNIPFGASIALSKKWSFCGEYDFGTDLSAVGFAVMRTF